MQKIGVELPDGVTLNMLKYLPTGFSIFDISASIYAGNYFRLPMAAQILLHLETEAVAVANGAANRARSADFDKVEYLTPLSVVKHIMVLKANEANLPVALVAQIEQLE